MNSNSYELPMFPLGTVLFPGAPLSLTVFEPRYRALLTDCLAGSREFGVVLIERGSEVGGGDVRTSVGTVAEVVDASAMADDRWGVLTLGRRRLVVRSWLADDPYPRALVEDWPDELTEASETADALGNAVSLLRRCLALQTELGLQVAPSTFNVPEDSTVASYLLSAVAPVGPLDRHHLLCEPGPCGRLRLLGKLLADVLTDLSHRFG